jgi:hypothetical protein
MNATETYKQEYLTQKSNAKRRGISWEFTYKSWLEFWGDDIDRRGTSHDSLCMQRFGDIGPYSPDNVKKGYPMDNMKTAGVIRRHKNIKAERDQHISDMDAVFNARFMGGIAWE